MIKTPSNELINRIKPYLYNTIKLNCFGPPFTQVIKTSSDEGRDRNKHCTTAGETSLCLTTGVRK